MMPTTIKGHRRFNLTKSAVISLLVFIMIFSTAKSDCSSNIYENARCHCSNYHWNCYGSCFNYNNGNQYGCSSGGNPYYHVGYRQYRYDTRYRVNIYQFCHPWCTSCYGSSNWNCDSCVGGTWHWQTNSWQSNRVCTTYCPRIAYSLNQPTYVGQYRPNGGTQCTDCPNYCSWCEDWPSQNTCYTCTSGYYLFDDRSSQCQNTFGFDFSSSGFTIPQAQYCHASCPSYYYFPVSQASTGSYTSWTDQYPTTDDAGSAITPRRNSDVCVPCSFRCRTCNGQSNTQCSSCTINSYFWIQNSWQTAGATCESYCPRAEYYAGQPSYVGQYKLPDLRTCGNCPNYCSWCQDHPSQNTCYTCTSGYYLFDDRSNQCQTTFGFDFTDAGFSIPQAQYCYVACPMYYFGVNQSAASGSTWATWTNSINLTSDSGASVTVRRTSDVCVPCSYRCRVCTGQAITQCSSCTINSYFWIQTAWQTAGATCNYYCPRLPYTAGQPSYVGQYKLADLKTCGNCPNFCGWCQDFPNQNTCYTCTSGKYLFDDRSNQCSNTFGFDFTDSGFSIPQAQYCYTTCPMYYFGVNRSATGTASYTSWTNAITLPFDTGANVVVRRQSDVCIPCSYRCRVCTGRSNIQCSVCTINSYKWIANAWQGAANTCQYYCPRASYTAGQLTYVGQYKQADLKTCGNCPNFCSWCQDQPSQNTCYTCTSGKYLFDDRSNECSTIFGFDFTDAGFSIPQAQYCYTTCPMYYFGVNQSATGSASYTSWTNTITLPDDTGVNVVVRRQSDVCIPCSYRCRVCTGRSNIQCSVCTINSYKWIANAWQGAANTCQYYCPRASYTAGQLTYVGQYKQADLKTCGNCPNFCSWCQDQPNQNTCYTCTSGKYLFDDRSNQCSNIYGFDFADSGFSIPQAQYCYTTCPMYYFGVNQSATGSYTNWTNLITLNDDTGAAVVVRRQSDVCVPCYFRCRACTGYAHTQCSDCTINSYLWIQRPWQASATTCHYYCPRAVYSAGNPTYVGQYVPSTGRVCLSCPNYCSWCKDGANYDYCYTCTAGYYLVDDTYNECNPTFGFDHANSGVTCATSNRCYAACPMYYFGVNKTNTGLYTWTATPVITYAPTGSVVTFAPATVTVQIKRESDTCVPCDYRCRTCFGILNSQCYTCTKNSYLSIQAPYSNNCDTFCRTGGWLAGQNIGEYIVAGIGLTSRVCTACDSNCKFCLSYNYKCYLCRDTAFLLDNMATCQSTFPAPTIASRACSACVHYQTNFASQSCQSRDQMCMNTRCPNNFYFQTYRILYSNTSAQQDWSVNFNRYNSYTLSASIDGTLNNVTETYVYRSLTNLCVLCDFRCIKCVGPTNYNCSQCRNNYYKWQVQTICQDQCPPGQWEDHTTVAPFQQTLCQYCDNFCYECDISSINCTRCKGDNYQFTNANASYLYNYNQSYSRCLASCPVSPNNSTTRGYYASIYTMTCYQCPGGCSNCNIDLMRTAVTNGWFSCGTDQYCLEGLICTSCLLGYSLVSGQCIEQNSCRKYAYYLPGNVSSQWTASKCFCLRGYFMNNYVSCDVLCHISCLTCNGAASNQCTSCESGFTLSAATGGTCSSSQIIRSDIYTATTSETYYTNAYATSYTCTYPVRFGYLSSEAAKFIYYQSPTIATNYYAVSVKMRVMFIDQWPQNGAIYVHYNNNGTISPDWTWTYNNFGAMGEQACGTNDLDYLMTLYGQVKTQLLTTAKLYITSNVDLLQTQTGITYYWGMKDMLVTVLRCHASCSTCTGPLITDCIVCSDAKKVVVNGTCTCNTASNFFFVSGASCNTGCPGGYTDYVKAICVYPTTTNCTAPYLYGGSDGNCTQTCSAGYYATDIWKKCVNDCGQAGLAQYKYDGAQRTCETNCPNGFIAYAPSSTANWYCVKKCPANYYLMLQNRSTHPKCTDNCPSGWQDDNLNQCISTCPNGYYKQAKLNGSSISHNKCVKVCDGAFGNNVTGQCVSSCPSPTYADPTTQLCKSACPSTYFSQIANVGGNRTCTQTCESGQFGNTFFWNCSNNSMDCPDGYYADSNTKLCQQTCSVIMPGSIIQVAQNSTRKCQTTCTTGYADYEFTKTCVSICPAFPSRYGFLNGATRRCVSSCNFATTGVNNLFGDDQANRTCVQRCTATPTATFGQSSTSLCVQKCANANQYGDPLSTNRYCVTSCTQSPITYSFLITKMCIATCPDTYYGDRYSDVTKFKCSTACPASYWGNPISHVCQGTCPTGYYGNQFDSNRPCVSVCPSPYFGQYRVAGRICVSACDGGYWADEPTRLCTNVKTQCSNTTYADASQKLCVNGTSCSLNSYADNSTKGCEPSCTNPTIRFGDPSTHLCVAICPSSPDYYSQSGYCVSNCNPQFADYQNQRSCVARCSNTSVALYANRASFRCVLPAGCPASHYADNQTQQCINPCNLTLPFGDPISRQCVLNCPDTYYGSPLLKICVQNCDNSAMYFADNITGNCQLTCSVGTYGVNDTTKPMCQYQCPPNSYAKDGIQKCVSDCGENFYGDPITKKCYSNPKNCSQGYYGNSVSHLCVIPANCQTVSTVHYFAQNSTKTCIDKCESPNYGDSLLWLCIGVCNQTSFGQNTTRKCLSGCAAYSTYAQPQYRLCVNISDCAIIPISRFSDSVNYLCVQPLNCPPNTYADNQTRKCVTFCPSLPVTLKLTYADVYVSKYCVINCPDLYYADDSTGNGFCVSTCAGLYRFRDNSTKSCVSICPSLNKTFGDSSGDMCVPLCPPGTFAQQDTNRRCVGTCAPNSWGNSITRVCVTNPLLQCPEGTWADDFTHLCTPLCSSSQNYYGYNLTKRCVTACISPSFAYDPTRVCIDICPASLVDSGLFGDPSTTPTRKCFSRCQTPNLYRDIAASRTCQAGCTYNANYKTYADPTTMSCQAICSSYPQIRYADDFSKSCQLSCSNGYRLNDTNQKCVASCSNLWDPTSNKCVDICPRAPSTNYVMYANLDNKTCVQASDCPTSTYASDDLLQCVQTCPNNTYIYLKNCVTYCPNGFYKDNVNQRCVASSNCPTGTFADDLSISCVTKCPGNFGESKKCVNVCSGSNYGNFLTGLCETSCTLGYVINTATRLCVSDCPLGTFKNPGNNSCSPVCLDPYFADSTTNACVTTCSSNPLTFSSTSSGRVCTHNCLSTQWTDLVNRRCVGTCSGNTYSYPVNRTCVAYCPSPNYYSQGTLCVLNCSSNYSDDTTRQCRSTCPSGFYKDSTTYRCVTECPINWYGSTTGTVSSCVDICPNGTFADQQQKKCVTSCSTSPPLFAYQSTHVCIQSCPGNTYADLTTYTCTTSCPSGYFADNTTKQCLSNCSVVNLFADSNLIPKACTNYCSISTQFADQLSFKCVTTCPTGYYKYSITRKCVQFCPFGYFADNNTFSCVTSTGCSSAFPYADSLTRQCVKVLNCSRGQWAFLAVGTSSGGSCRAVCPPNYYSNPLSKRCQTSCPPGLFASTVNQTCSNTCSVNLYMDSVNKACVPGCPSLDKLFGDPFTRKCVTVCNVSQNIYADSLTQKCAITCSGNQYSYFVNNSYICVNRTSCGGGLYADPFYKKCVSQCYNNTYGYSGLCYTTCPTTPDLYADPIKKICVASIDCSAGLYADTSKRACVSFCDIATLTFAHNTSTSKRCVPTCPGLFFADNSTRTCVLKCPDVPKLYGQSNICVQNCNYLSFADPTSNLCAAGCQNEYFADISTLKCVLVCPQGTFGDDTTNQCLTTCSSLTKNYFGQPISRLCTQNCPNNTFSDPNNNRQCRPYCLPPRYAQNSTNSCQLNCLTGYSNPRTQQCIEVCTVGYYGYNGVCYNYSCPTASPTVYADDETNLCQQTCPDGTYGDLTSLKCVKICPIANLTFADPDNNVCTRTCPDTRNADNSTRTCVKTCPQIPAMFSQSKVCVLACRPTTYADNFTRSCVSVTSCPNGTYADNSTYKCVSRCPTKPLMYGLKKSNLCVIYCPLEDDLYAENTTQTCVSACPNETNTYADPIKGACVTTCSSNYFAVESTRRCQLSCAVGFKDTLLRKCVSTCSIDPIFYGNTKTNTCISKCVTNSYGDPLTQQCKFDAISGKSTCPTDYFADITTQLCVKKCPMRQDLYANQQNKKCSTFCPTDFLKDNSTMTCVRKCPKYPNYYADLNKTKCVPFCPIDHWADDVSRECVKKCPNNTFAENSTWRCVKQCLRSPLTFGDTVAWTCVSVCPNDTYSYFQTFLCLESCPNGTFADNSSQTCLKICPNNTFAHDDTNECLFTCPNNTYADNSSNSCVNVCPKYPAYYADTKNNTCVSVCPQNYYAYQDTRECVQKCPLDTLYRQDSSSSCVSFCRYQQNTYADNFTGRCVEKCSNGSYADPTTRICVQKCPDQPPMFALDGDQTCVKTCPGQLFGDNTTRSCVDQCPTNSLSLLQNNLCVLYCPIGFFAYIPTAYCMTQCPYPYYADPSTRSCVQVCPVNQLLFADNSTHTCVPICPDGSYADQKSKECVKQCPVAVFPGVQTYAADYNNRCVQQCSLPTFAYIPLLKCVNQCPNPYFNNVTDHICYKCPTICNSCTSPTSCRTCISGYYLQNGACLSQCTGIYYANTTSMRCVVSNLCKPFFGDSLTNLCRQTCPTGFFANTSIYRCDACPETCESCSSLSNCSSCKSQAQIYNNICHGFCNSTDIYYDTQNKTCLAECPLGTYLFVLFCKPCASNCTNCIGTATNCTICANGLYLQGLRCVSKCDSGFKPVANLSCVSCGTTCGDQLTFNTNITTIDGQSTVFLNFSSAVDITGDLYDTFRIVTNTSRRLLASSGYIIEIINPTTIRIIFPPGENVQNVQIQITNPANIQDQYGNIPSSVRSQVIADISNLYGTSIKDVPSELSNYFYFLSVVAIFAFMFEIQLLKFLQLVYVHYFVFMTLPPQLTKVLIGLKTSTLDYVPSLYQIPKADLLSSVPGKLYDLIGDFSFLRNASSTITLMVIVIGSFLILKLLSLPEINRFKKSRVWIRQLIDQKFSYAVFVDLMSIVFMNTIFMAFLQLKDYTFYDSFSTASVIIAHIFIALIFAIVGYLSYRVINFFIQYPKLSQNLKKASQIILKDQQIKLLNSTNIFLFEMKKIDLRNVLYPKVNNQNILPFRCVYRFNFLSLLCPIVTFLRAILLSIILVFAPDTITQMVLAIALNFLTLLYFIRARPYSFKYHKYRVKNYLAIFHEASLIVLQFLLLVLGVMYKNQKSAQQKQDFSYSIVYLLTFIATVSFLFLCFRIWLQLYRKAWIPFIQSQTFKKNFPVKYAQYQAEKEKNKKFLKGIDPKAKQALKALIKGYKSQKSSLRPNENDKLNPQLPIKYKITYFDRDSSSVASSGTSLSKKQKRSMLKEIFTSQKDKQLKNLNQKELKQYEQILSSQDESATQVEQFEQYEEEIEIKAKDLSKYIANAQEILRLHRKHEEEELQV